MAAPSSYSTEQYRHRDPKISKKLGKILRKLSSKEFLKLSSSSSRILCVQNGGLGNDVCQEELLPLFIPFGEVENIIMMPRKPFCFVYFLEESTSVAVFDKLNGHVLKHGKDPSQDVILYFLFVEKSPECVMPLCDKPNGLCVVEDFIDEETEIKLLSLMTCQDMSDIGSSMKHRRVKHYGFEFKYDINDVDVTDPLPGGLPTVCHPIIQKAVDDGHINHHPDQLTINQYQPGQGIPSHVDTEDAFEDGIMSLSLGSQTVMEFRHPDGRQTRAILPQRSLMVLTGESRYIWSHGITPRKSDIVPCPSGKGLTLHSRGVRTSFTFRKVVFDRKQEKSSTNSWSLPQTEDEARKLEKEHVHKVYEDIADHFSGTRYKPWPRVVEFLKDQPSHSLMADIGCGNGKCLGVNRTMFEVGCDYSTNLLSICRSRGFQTCVADVCGLPFRSSAFDVVLCIAVIHHMATKSRRLKAVTEIVRVLCPGGQALIYVWAMEQHLDKVESKYIKTARQKQIDAGSFLDMTNISEDCDRVMGAGCEDDNCSKSDGTEATSEVQERKQSSPTNCVNSISSESEVNAEISSGDSASNCSARTLKVHVNRTEFQEQDLLVPWQLKGKEKVTSASSSPSKESTSVKDNSVFHRFYHVFKQSELEELCQTVGGCVIRKSYYDQGNWCVVLEKL